MCMLITCIGYSYVLESVILDSQVRVREFKLYTQTPTSPDSPNTVSQSGLSVAFQLQPSRWSAFFVGHLELTIAYEK